MSIQNGVSPKGTIGTSRASLTGNWGRGMLGFAAGILLGITGIATGILLLFLPPIGWVVGPVVILGSLALPVVLAIWGSRMVARHCPYCGSRVVAVPSGGSITCHRCNLPVRVEGAR